MTLMNSCAVFSTPEAIFLSELLKPSISPCTLQKVSVPFYYVEVKEHGQKYVNFLNRVMETPQTCKVDRGAYT